MSTTIYGIVEFPSALFCSAEVLGQSFSISIGGHDGLLYMPVLPDITDGNISFKKLLGPSVAEEWKTGDKHLEWGSVNSDPEGNSHIDMALLEFYICDDNLNNVAQEIYDDIEEWLTLLERYIIILATQNINGGVSSNERYRQLRLYNIQDEKIQRIPRHDPIMLNVSLAGKDNIITLHHLMTATRLSSEKLPLRSEYLMLLESYRARKNKDNRKAIIEAATALEICLTKKIKDEFDLQKIDFGERLLQKFRMLGGKFELARILGIPLPEKDYTKLILNPRNDVIHKNDFPEAKEANSFISEVEELLKLFSPCIYQK